MSSKLFESVTSDLVELEAWFDLNVYIWLYSTALRVGFKIMVGSRYKTIIMGVYLDGCVWIKVDNMSVVNDTSIPESTLNINSNPISDHFFRESCAVGIGRVFYDPT